MSVLCDAALVCHSWLDAAKVPGLWRSIEMATSIPTTDLNEFNREFFCTMAMVAVHRSAGRLKAFAGRFFVSDELLYYIAQRSPSLVSLTVIDSDGVTDQALEAVVDACPRLERLQVVDCFNVEFNAALAAKCAGIRSLNFIPYDDLEVLAYVRHS